MGRRRARLWALFQCCIPKAKAKTRKNLASAQVLEAERPEELATSTEEELNVCQEQLFVREEEIALLNAERNNIMLLVEHLECRVSRYIPSLETTAGKWQAQSPDGMTNELEVLQALKSLFEHHKALDKKCTHVYTHINTRGALERYSLLEELGATHNKLMILKEKNNLKKILMDRVLDVNHKQENMPSANGKRTRDEDLAQVIELQDIIEKKSREQREMRDRLAALSAHVTELEKDLDTARKDLLKSKEANVKLQQDVREAMAQKEDMEKRITTLEKRYLAAQRKAISVHNLHDKLENEIANKDSMHRQKEDKDRQLQECLELAEQKLQQMLTEVVAELTPRVAVLSESELLSSGSSATKEAKLLELTSQVRKEERAKQREKMNEEHNEHSSDTVDKLLSVSDERLQLHLKERMAALEDKVQPLKDQDRELEQQASVLANLGQLFESDKGVSDGEGDRDTLFSAPALLSPSGPAVAKTLAMRIQEQLDKINEEIWLIQKDKENTDQRAEGIESRVGSGSFSNLRRFESSSSLNLDPASSHAGSFPPSRGRSMPERRQPSPEPEEDKLGFMTLPSDLRKHRRKLPAIQEEVEDDTIKCETSTSTSLRSFHLDRLTGSLHIASDEDIRDADNATGSQDGPRGNPSNSNSSQKAPKKKGIKSSIGRWFGKKEKSRPGHTSKEALGPVAGRMFTASATWKAPGSADN
ncbi:liprin-alpha-1-like [Ovis canadensis]|uniref:liprin-alpha-1-like n=1 Tax=Ovis canadensis TaxID=37174 RepID=UPI0037500AF2